jgi:carbon monoxide dehydrogenase subunit G
MSSFSTSVTISAPLEAVWAALADIGSISVWNPGVKASHTTSEISTGLGATRHCDLGGRSYLHEEVVHFDEGKALTMRIVGTNLPFKTADIEFRLAERGNLTDVEVAPKYELKFGVLAALLDRLYVRRTYEKGMQALLRGLKRHVEESVAT